VTGGAAPRTLGRRLVAWHVPKDRLGRKSPARSRLAASLSSDLSCPPCYRPRHDSPQATGLFSRVRHRGGRRRPVHHVDPERPAMNAPRGRTPARRRRGRSYPTRLSAPLTRGDQARIPPIDRRHFCVHATRQVGIPWAVDRDKEQVSVWSDPALVKHLARRVIVAARPPFFLLLSAFGPHDPGA